MRIIKLEKEHIKEALSLVWRVFQEFESPEYSKEGIREFKNFIDYESMIQKFCRSEILLWGCIDKEKLVGIIGIREMSHISLLFVDKEYHKRGIGRQLFKIVEGYYKSETNLKEITVNSSPYAVKFYHKIGFSDTDVEKDINGIRFTPMKYYFK